MKFLLLKLLILFGLSFLLLLPVVWKFSLGYSDPFYTRLTTPAAPSLIIGTSRAAQGLLPQEFQELAPKLQNFAFTLGHTPFGPAYLSLIKKKVADTSEGGLFIIAVDPWAVSSLSKKEDRVIKFREQDSFANGITFTNINPSLEYIFRFYDRPLYRVFQHNSHQLRLHENGWLEVNVPMDPVAVQQRIQEKVKDYDVYAREGFSSKIRMEYLEETVQYLKGHGRVVLVRLPVAPEMAAIENKFALGFDAAMQELSRTYAVPYVNYFGDSGKYLTTDGNHLYKEAGRDVSRKLALDIVAIDQKSCKFTSKAFQ